MTIEDKLPGFQKDISLKEQTTFKIGGRAKYLFVAKNDKDVILAIETAKELNLPFFILGGGSKLLVSDEGYEGLVIKIQNTPKENLRFPTGQAKSKTIYTGAGIPLASVVSGATKNSLTGLEWAAGIPGTVGGAIRGNAGTFGSSMANITKMVKVLEIQNRKSKIENFKNEDCEFDYRESIFKKNANLIILSAELQLKKGEKEEIKEKIKEHLNYRRERQPLEFPSAGSIFKNPRIRPGFGEQASSFSAGELIEKCGLKGKRSGDVKISEKHANFIVNLGNGKAKDVIKLIKLIKTKVKNKFNVELKEELQYLGF